MENLEVIEIKGKDASDVLRQFLGMVFNGKIEDLFEKHNTEKEVPEVKVSPRELYEKAVERIADKKEWTLSRTLKWIGSIAEVSTLATINLLLKQMALILDEKYYDHISKSENLFVISTMTGMVVPCPNRENINFRSASLFRTVEDALLAKAALSKYFSQLGL